MEEEAAGAVETAGTGEAGARAVALWAKSAAGASAAARASETNRFLMDFLVIGSVVQKATVSNAIAAPRRLK